MYGDLLTVEESLTLPVTEIYCSIQGEGVNIGLPAVFLRTTYCNLWCAWCDSKFTWKNGMIETTNLTLEDINKRILGFKHCRLLVVTGGEPLLHLDKLSRLFEVVKRENDFEIEIETNGTIRPTSRFDSFIAHYDVSPKTSNSGIDRKHRIKPEAIKFFNSSPKADFKFVIVNPDDLKEILELIEEGLISKEKVILMPEGTSAGTLCERSSWLVEVCRSYGFRFSPRLHILLWGNERTR